MILSADLSKQAKPSRSEGRREHRGPGPGPGYSTDLQVWCSRPGQYTTLRRLLITERFFTVKFIVINTKNPQSSRSSERHQPGHNSGESNSSDSGPSSRSSQASRQGSSGGQQSEATWEEERGEESDNFSGKFRIFNLENNCHSASPDTIGKLTENKIINTLQ